MANLIVQVKNLGKTYDNGVQALKDVTFEMFSGEIFGLIGVNGAGKTTLIRILTTMLRPTTGKCEIMGIDPTKEPEKVRSFVGVLPQDSGLYNEFTIKENLHFIGEMQGMDKQEINLRIHEVANILNLNEKLNTRVDHLSGGLTKRAMIARSLIGKPKILFLDEPTSGLDVLVARKVRKTILDLKKDMSIFLATHNMYEAYQLCTKIAILHDGKILLIDSPSKIFNDYKKEHEDFEDVIANILGIDEQEILEGVDS